MRRLRAESGLTLDEVAEQMTCSTSKISRLETGKGVPKVPDVRELMRIYGVTSDTEINSLLRLVRDGREHGWWESYLDGVQPERFMMDAPARYAALETAASRVSAFEIAWLHGLLQSPAYAAALLRALLGEAHDPIEIDRLVGLRLRRQAALLDRDPALQVRVVLDESVLARVVGGPGVMAAALDHLLARAALPNVTVRVLPHAAGVHRAHAGPIVLLEFPPDAGSDVVYVEGHAGETLLERTRDVVLYKVVLDDLWTRSLDPDATRDLVRRYRHQHAAPRERTFP